MKKKLILFWIVMVFLFSALPVQAQESSSSAKSVLRNFKFDLKSVVPLANQTNCSLKSRGDANCDGVVNEFDLSLWQVEFNSASNPGRADFNSNGKVDLVDFGIWRDSVYPQKVSFFSSLVQKVASLMDWSVTAAGNSTSSQVNSSVLVNSQSGTNQVINSTNTGTQQISFDSQGNPTTTQLFDSQGRFKAAASFLSGGGTLVNTQQNGYPVQIYKTIEGPVIEYFSNPDGSLIAVKSWPNPESLANNEPPISVSLPSKNNQLLTLNINPNGAAIVAHSDQQGALLSESSTTSDGSYLSTDLASHISTRIDGPTGLSTIAMDNTLGGKTTYHFYKSALFAIVQTNKDGAYYLAQPQGNSWLFKSNVGGVTSETTVDDPIAKAGGNTPSPQALISAINYYTGLSTTPSGITFQDAFGSSASIQPSQFNQANQMLKVAAADIPPQPISWFPHITEALAATDLTAASAAALASSGSMSSTAQTGTGPGGSSVSVSSDGTQTATVTDTSGAVVATANTNTGQDNTFTSDNVTGNTNTAVKHLSLGINFTPTYGTTPIPIHVEENMYHSEDSCFLAGTLISTPNGPLEIQQLKPGMKVYSYNEKTHQKEISDFSGLDINLVDEYLILNHKIHVTTYHPFYVFNLLTGLHSLVKADQLKKGDLLMNELGELVNLSSIERIQQKQTVYNLKNVSSNNNFFADGILVHNYNDDNYSKAGSSNGDTSSNDNSGGGNNDVSGSNW